jgi:uncharacterized protein YdeI (YjbR/CyaY-like superfamily)
MNDTKETEKLHDLPADMQNVLKSNPDVMAKWETLTPLTKNEWICWTTTVKQEKTRIEHVERMKQDLLKGKRRPCCWPGCPHRSENAKSRKFFDKSLL